MLIELDGLAIPPSVSTTVEVFDNDTYKRSVTGEQIVKKGYSKYRITLDYSNRVIGESFRLELYAKLNKSKRQAVLAKFLDPETMEEIEKNVVTVSKSTPTPSYIQSGTPTNFTGIRATLEEV